MSVVYCILCAATARTINTWAIIFLVAVLLLGSGCASTSYKLELAADPKTSPDKLIRLAEDNSISVKERVAGNPNTPPTTLEKLAEDSAVSVRRLVARNANTSPTTLTRLCYDKDWWVGMYLSENPKTPSNALENLAIVWGGPDPQFAARPERCIPANIAAHPHVTPKILSELAAHPFEPVRNTALNNPRLSADSRNKAIALNKNRERRKNAAQTPPSLIELFMKKAINGSITPKDMNEPLPAEVAAIFAGITIDDKELSNWQKYELLFHLGKGGYLGEDAFEAKGILAENGGRITVNHAGGGSFVERFFGGEKGKPAIVTAAMLRDAISAIAFSYESLFTTRESAEFGEFILKFIQASAYSSQSKEEVHQKKQEVHQKAQREAEELLKKIACASSIYTSPSELAQMAIDKHPAVLAALAGNPKTPVLTLLEFSQEEAKYGSAIKQVALQNQSLNTEALAALAGNPSTSPACLWRLAFINNPQINKVLLVNPTWIKLVKEYNEFLAAKKAQAKESATPSSSSYDNSGYNRLRQMQQTYQDQQWKPPIRPAPLPPIIRPPSNLPGSLPRGF